jgi:hypothetical protein
LYLGWTLLAIDLILCYYYYYAEEREVMDLGSLLFETDVQEENGKRTYSRAGPREEFMVEYME